MIPGLSKWNEVCAIASFFLVGHHPVHTYHLKLIVDCRRDAVLVAANVEHLSSNVLPSKSL